MNTATDRRTLVLACDVCKEPVTGYEGHVYVSNASIARVERATEEVRRNRGGRLLSDKPGPRTLPADEFRDLMTDIFAIGGSASWRVHHYRCWPDHDYDSYGFTVDEIDTVEKLLDKTAKMLEVGRTWLPYTNWSEFLRRVLKANGRQP